jgi:hypothetical protein
MYENLGSVVNLGTRISSFWVWNRIEDIGFKGIWVDVYADVTLGHAAQQ